MTEPGVFRPSRVLGLLLCIVSGLFLGLVWWQFDLPDADVKRKFAAAQWVLAFAAFTAMAGWMTNAIITMRNSVKQHTVNTLLQSRLSATYMDKATKVNTAFTSVTGRLVKLTAEQAHQGDASLPLEELRYFLNYFEFIAVGIRHGDLDEDLMKASHRGMLLRMYDVCDELIKARSKTDSRTFEHLKWLKTRWADQSTHAKSEGVIRLLVYAAGLLVPAILTGPFLDTVSGRGAIIQSAATTAPALAAKLALPTLSAASQAQLAAFAASAATTKEASAASNPASGSNTNASHGVR